MCLNAQAQALVFSTPTNVSKSGDYSWSPQVAVDAAGNINVVWEDDSTGSASTIFFSRSTDGGTTFSTPKPLSNGLGSPTSPRIAVDSNGGINVVWVDNILGNYVVFFSRSSDGGLTFTPKSLPNGPADAGNPQVAVDTGGNICVVWENDDITLGAFFSHSMDGGSSFSTPINLATNNPAGSLGSYAPQIAIGVDGSINVVWQDTVGVQSVIRFSRSADHGANFFPAPTHVSTDVGNSTSPQIALDSSGNINIAWVDDSPGNFAIFFARSTDKGATFPSVKNISNSAGDTSGSPQVGTDASGNILVAWQKNLLSTIDHDIYFARSSDGGATFSPVPPRNVSNSANAGDSMFPWMTVDTSGDINLGWQYRSAGKAHIVFARSADAGATFPTQNLSNDSNSSIGVQIAADQNGNLDVVWSDDTLMPGLNQIFFRRFSDPKTVNQAPVANAGPDQTLPSAGPAGTPVTLNGSASKDPDGDTLKFQWKDENNNVVGNSAIVSVTVLTGVHTFTLTVTDPGGLSSSAVTHVTILNGPPVANAGPNQTVQCAGHAGTPVTLNGSKSSDPDGDTLSFVWMDAGGNVVGRAATVQLTVAMGTHTFTLTVTDPGGLTSTAATHVIVQDTVPPTLSVSLSPNNLWPANHKLVQITATIQASDVCDASPTVQLVSITSNELIHVGDIQAVGGGAVPFGTDVRSFLLRAAHSSSAATRIYTVTYMAKDASGNPTRKTAQVRVGPKGHKKHK
jgi:phosphatidylethanolamine-binding protein (PEBP) family uncharacterized protein